MPNRKQAAAAFAIALALLIFNDLFVFESLVVPTSSMRPTILPNERVILNHLSFGSLHRFDVAVIRERGTGKRIVKRIIGLPGDHVRLEGSWKVFINGQPLAYSGQMPDGQRTEAGTHLIQVVGQDGTATQFGKDDLLLGPDEYFVLGDNRLASSDSRVIGPVKRTDIQGTVTFVWYSFDLVRHRLRTERLMHWIQ
jgi:signal peptidase I